MEKLYVVVRADLPPGAQLAQSCHAVSAFAADFPKTHEDWHRHGQNLVVLQIPDEPALTALLEFAIGSDAVERVSMFREPDFGHQLTACAFDEGISRYVSSLPLALRAHRASAA